jgi:hypothetical protein
MAYAESRPRIVAEIISDDQFLEFEKVPGTGLEPAQAMPT